MCSTNTEIHDDGIEFMTSEPSNNLRKYCRKCTDKTEAKIVLRRKDAYCKACLGKSKLMKPGDKVLIGFSGSNNSVALLHLVKTGLLESSHKKLMFQPYIMFVDETAVLNLPENGANKLVEEIRDLLKQFDFPVYQVPISLSTQSEESLEAYLTDGNISVESGASLTELFSSLKSVSSRIDMLSKLRYNLMVQTAKSLGCSKVFMAESADDLAVKLLANVSLGRGAQLPYDVGFSDDRIPEVKVIRPLCDLTKKELTVYNVFHHLTTVHVPSISTKLDTHSSIQKLTESFLSELQDGFPSTLSTVFRVADKLSTSSSNQTICPLCKTQRETEASQCSSLKATQFSRLVATLGPTNFDAEMLTNNSSDSDCKGEVGGCCGKGSCSSQSLDQDFQEVLCYGCNLILKDADFKTLPPEFMRFLQSSSQRLKMKKEIEEFLL